MSNITKKYSYADQLKTYPKPDEYRSGCKVAWHIYKKLADAEKCSAAAMHNATIKAAEGYDFGYCGPGSITKLDDGRYEVCIP